MNTTFQNVVVRVITRLIPGPFLSPYARQIGLQIQSGLALALGLLAIASPARANEELRSFLPLDLLRGESIAHRDHLGGSFSISRLGAIAWGMKRSKISSPGHTGFDEMTVVPFRGDIYVSDPSNPGLGVNITEGAKDSSGWWSPLWSPDGTKLAMISTRSNGSLWIWDAHKRSSVLVAKDFKTPPSAAPLFAWIDAEHLIALVEVDSPDAVKDLMSENLRVLAKGWKDAMEGVISTASVLISAPGVSRKIDGPRYELRRFSLHGAPTKIAREATADWRVSPDGRLVAFIREDSFTSKEARDFRGKPAVGSSLAVVSTEDGREIHFNAPLRDVANGTLCWSRDSSELAFYSRSTESRDAPVRLQRVNSQTGEVTVVDIGLLEPFQFSRPRWTAKGEVLIWASPRSSGTVSQAKRYDWYLTGKAAGPAILTGSLTLVPLYLTRYIFPVSGGAAFVLSTEGKLWRIDADSGEPSCLTKDLPAVDLVWPSRGSITNESLPDREYSLFVVATANSLEKKYYLCDATKNTYEAIACPAGAAELVAFDPISRQAYFSSDDANGLRLWRVSAAAGNELILDRNQFRRETRPTQWRYFDYVSEAGQPLQGLLALPDNYQEGRRYPLIVFEYPEDLAKDFYPGGKHNPENESPMFQGIYTGKGYAVLFPSIPLLAQGPDNPYLKLTNGVLPAVDAAIRMGIADEKRLFVAGQSFGGFGAFGLVTQTNRFTAAFALCGFSNIASQVGTIPTALRYLDNATSNPGFGWSATIARNQTRMSKSLWEDPERYIRNSPIFLTAKVTTPILIAHGDRDGLPIEQSEEFFTSLFLQGKRADFVRYWGEAHGFESPANILDITSRVLAWFDEFGDIARDDKGNLLWDGDRVKSRNGAPALKPEDFARFDKQMLEDFAKAYPDSATAKMLREQGRN